MARREDEDKFWIDGNEAWPCIHERGFFALDRAAGNDEAKTRGHRLQPARGFGFLRGTHVELEIAGNGNAIGTAAQSEQPVGVDLALREHAAETREQRTPEVAQLLIARP